MVNKQTKQKDRRQSQWVRTWVKILTTKDIDELLPCVGDVKDIADFIEADEFGLCASPELPDSVGKVREKQKRRSQSE